MILCRCVGQRKPNLKTRVTRLGSDLNVSPVLLHNSLDSVQAEASALSNSFSSEKGFEDVGLYLGGNPGAIVSNLNHNATVLAISANSKLALSAHGVDGIVDDVGPDLVELAAKRIHEKRNALVVALHRHSLFQLVIQDRKRGFQALYYIDVLDRRLVHVGVFLDRTDQIRYPRSATLDFV